MAAAQKTPTTDVEVAVAIGRIEEGINGLREDVRRIAEQGSEHSNTIGRHEARLAVLESKQGSWRVVVIIIGAVIGAAGFTLALLDRLYT